MSNKIIHFAYKCLLLLGIFLGLCTSIKGAQPPSNFKNQSFLLRFPRAGHDGFSNQKLR